MTKPIRKENKPVIYWCRYASGLGYWRVKPAKDIWGTLRVREREARILANNFCSRLNGKAR